MRVNRKWEVRVRCDKEEPKSNGEDMLDKVRYD